VSRQSNRTGSEADPQMNLLNDFWGEDAQTPSFNDKEEERVRALFVESINNTRLTPARSKDEGVSRKIQVGLYASDAALLEELFLQGKNAGLPNVSRARILRVALRHFHTCWLHRTPD
jgi:hypothetical protein